jgi:2,4-dienoyl-CoA reductase-like NADH-dependent reductase (Old Yellow Enzyme family)
MNFPNVFSTFTVGKLELSNRIVMPPMVIRKASDDGSVTSVILDHYARSIGPGLTVVEAAVVSPEGRLDRNQLGIFDDRHTEGLAKLARVIHEGGSAASIQIHHAGRNTSEHSTFGLPLVAPSANTSIRGNARALTEVEIEGLITSFVSAARRAREAGFDAVEVHAAHGYLISQFLSPLANRREDRWGGSLEKRVRFLREVLSRIRAANTDILAYCRLGIVDGENGGLTLDEGIQTARWLEADGIPLIHVSNGIGAPPVAGENSPYNDRFHLGMTLKRALTIPVISVGGIRFPEQAETALADGVTDLVAVGRGLLVDPQWVLKAMNGRTESINPCRNCTVCHRFLYPERCPAARSQVA